MNSRILMMSVITAMLFTVGGILMTDATHTNLGYVEDSGTGVNPAKVTFEKAGEYEWENVISATGYYSQVLPNGSTGWYIDAMADGYDRDAKTNINEGTRNDFDISTRSEITVRFKVGYDDTTGVSESEARDELLRAEPWFRQEHGIVFDVYNDIGNWTSTGQSTTSCIPVLNHAESDLNWSYGNYGTSDILAAFSDGHMASDAAKGCAHVPLWGGTHPAMYVDIRTEDPDWIRDRLVAHELTHNYGFRHLASCPVDLIPNLMAMTNNDRCDGYITNWTPDDDITIENSRRTWY